VQNSERPQHYSEDRIDARLQTYDAELLGKKRFS
jgi:hypothetical protein